MNQERQEEIRTAFGRFERLERLRAEFEGFFIDPQIGMTVDQFLGREETFCGFIVSAESGNEILVSSREAGLGDFTVPAWDCYEYDGGISDVAQEWLKRHNAYFEFYNAGIGIVLLEEEQ